MTATVNAGATPVSPGQVNFCDATAASCTDIHLLATARLTTGGTAVVSFVPGVGKHSYKAVFVGTNTYTGSTSASSNLAVVPSQPYRSTTTLASGFSAGAYILTATVLGSGLPAPTGTVSFLDTSNANSTVGTATLGAATPGLDFITAPVPPTSGSPQVVGDFNGDGKADLAIVNNSGGPISILLGKGDGTFTAGGTVTVSPSGANPMAAGDFNGDGKTDLLVETFSSVTDNGSVTALLGNGDGTFTAAASSVIDAIPGQVAVGDLNHDGKLDLAVLNGANIAILLGAGDGTFTPTAAIAAAADVIENTSVTIGDFNGDGKADLGVMGEIPSPPSGLLPEPVTVSITVFLGKGDGTFTSTPSFSTCCGPSSLASGDFNGDGKLDLVFAESGERNRAQTVLLLGNGDGTFAEPQSFDMDTFSYFGPIAIGDFDGDGNADLAFVATSNLAPVSIELGSGAGTFALDQSGPATNASFFAIGDFDGNGTPDLALAGSDSMTILLTQPTRTATAVANGVSPVGPEMHKVEASYPGDGDYSASVSNTVDLSGIEFSVPNHTYGDAPFPIAATSVSTGAFTYSAVSGPVTVAGSMVTLTGAGSAVLQASQAATNSYQAGTQTTPFAISPANLTLTANSVARVFGAANPTFTGTVVGAVNGDTFSEAFSTAANPASMVGTYAIAPSVTGPNLAGYTVVPTSGTLTISQAGTATTFALSNQNATFTATVASLTSGTPTGTVAFYEGQTQVGAGTVSNGTASYTATTAPAGDVVVSAQYSGDANFTQSVSPPIQMLSVAAANSSLTVAAAGSVTDSVSLSSAPGYVGTVQLSCSGLPANATCSFQPSSVAFSGTNTAAKVMVTVETGVASQARFQAPQPSGEEGPNGIVFAVIWLPGIFTGIALRGGRKTSVSRRNQMLMLLLLLGGLCAGLSGCGGGSGPTGITKQSSTSTAAGTYAVQLVATGGSGLSQTTAVTLTVQ